MDLIYIGDHFYIQSGTMMSSLYTTQGNRFDWGLVQVALQRGHLINIRPATDAERAFYDQKLAELLKQMDAREAANKSQ